MVCCEWDESPSGPCSGNVPGTGASKPRCSIPVDISCPWGTLAGRGARRMMPVSSLGWGGMEGLCQGANYV